jgi:ribosomal protein L11 methyltransferase
MVRPPWEAPSAEIEIDVVIDPGQAFGTGAHATTRLCLELMLGVEPRGPFVDLGCGSGVLAIVASKLGWSPLRGYDFDRLAVEASVENADANDVAMQVDRADLRDGLPTLAPTVVANLMRPLLLDVAAQIPHDDHGIESLILSGLLDEEADEISAAFTARRGGLSERRRISEGGWTGLLLTT